MVIAYSFAALFAGAVSTAGLWPLVGPLALLATPFVASATALVLAISVRSRAANPADLGTPGMAADLRRMLDEGRRKPDPATPHDAAA
jgi:hypothetical protein